MKLNRHILIDCDPGTDDAMALLLASATMEARSLCFLSSYGNAALVHTHRNLLGITELLGLRGAIFRGEACPMGRDGFTSTDYHGENGLCSIALPVAVDRTEAGGIDGAAEWIRGAGRVTYVATGPLSNLALLLVRHPDLVHRLEEIVIMGGGIAFGNMPSGAEYNFALDPRAVAVVFDCPVRKVLAPLDLTHTLAFRRGEIEAMVGAEEDALRWETLRRRDVFGTILYRNLASALNEGYEGAVIHDAATIAYLVQPLAEKKACLVEEMRLRCDENGCISEADAADTVAATVQVIRWMDKPWLAELLRMAFGGGRAASVVG